jgi:hypothetical protein
VAKFRKLAAKQLPAIKRQQRRIADTLAGALAAAVSPDQLLMPAAPTPADHRATISSGSSSSSKCGTLIEAAVVVSTAVDIQQQQAGEDLRPVGCFGGLLRVLASRASKTAATACNSSAASSSGTAAAAAAGA